MDNKDVPYIVYEGAMARITVTTKTKYRKKKNGKSKGTRRIKGKKPDEVFSLVQELLDAIQVLNPNLYVSFMSKL